MSDAISSLLPPDALNGARLGVSASESPDLARLGFLESHFRIALGEIARCVLVSGGQLAYGGHLQPDGYTSFLVQELERYSRRNRPLRVCLAWSEHRRMTLSAIEASRRWLGLYGEIVCLDVNGVAVDPADGRGEAPMPIGADAMVRQGLTGLRQYMTSISQGQVLIGGRREGFQGEMPGLLEEALFAVQQGRPLYLVGGFGGITLDIAVALGVDDGKWFPLLPNGPGLDQRISQGMLRLTEAMKETGGKSFENGLSRAENGRLAMCHRPSEISALISLGLGRAIRGAQPKKS